MIWSSFEQGKKIWKKKTLEINFVAKVREHISIFITFYRTFWLANLSVYIPEHSASFTPLLLLKGNSWLPTDYLFFFYTLFKAKLKNNTWICFPTKNTFTMRLVLAKEETRDKVQLKLLSEMIFLSKLKVLSAKGFTGWNVRRGVQLRPGLSH